MLSLASIAHGYVFILDPSNCMSTWPSGTIPMQVKLAATPTLTDGTNYRSSVLAAMSEWNPYIDKVQLSGTGMAPGSYGIMNGTSEIVMDNNIGYGTDAEPFDQYVLAVTISIPDGNFVTESDIVINNAYQWDSFRGAQIGEKQDIRRVAAHELGHVLGLDHPDENMQDVTALMNHVVSYDPPIEGPVADDIAGAQAIYGAPGFVPVNDNFSNATEFFYSFGSEESMYGTNVSATKESGEPDLDPDDPGGKTVWWKWKATASGTLTLTTSGSNLDTLLAAYTGSSVDSLTGIALNDDLDPGVVRWSTITFDVVYGNTYYFAVDGWGGYVGLIQLNFSLVADPVTSPPLITSPPCSRNYFEGMGATIECGVSNPTGVTYVWKRNGQVLPGQTGSLFANWSLTVADSGHYEVVATNSVGSTVSRFDIIVSPNDLGIVAFGDTTRGQGRLPALMGGITSIDAAASYSLGVTAGGTLRVWGATPLGSEADTFNFSYSVAGAAGTDHFLALTRDGYVAGFGPYPATINAPGRTRWMPPSGIGKVIAIDMGQGRSVALLANGSVISWDEARIIPSPNGLNDTIAVAAGGRHFLALRENGTVIGWGESEGGATTPPMGLADVVAIAAGGDGQDGHSLALKSDGTVVAWGSNSAGQTSVPLGLGGIVDIAAGPNFSLALKSDGTVVGWGDGTKGQLIFPTTSGTPFKLAAGTDFGLALVRATGPIITVQPVDVTVMEGETAEFSVSVIGTPTISYAWRRYGVNLSNGGRISGATGGLLRITNAQLADAGGYNVEVSNQKGRATSVVARLKVIRPHSITERPMSKTVTEGDDLSVTVGVEAGGTYTFEWRHNRTTIPGATSATLDIHGATSADAGYYEVLVRNEMGVLTSTLFYVTVTVASPGIAVWGNVGNIPMPAISGPVSAVSDGGARVVLKGDGTVVAWGADYYGEATVPAGLSDVVAVSAGGVLTSAVKSDGSVVAWGGQNGVAPLPPASLDGIVAISSGGDNTIALKSDGTVITWGVWRLYGQPAPPPPIPSGLRDVVFVEAGSGGFFAVQSDGTVVGWGGSEFHETPPDGLSDVVSISSVSDHTIALKRDGSVVEWWFPVLETPSLSDTVNVAAGASFSVALDSDGKLSAWSSPGSYGQDSIPAGLSNVVSIAAGYDSIMALYRAAPPSVSFAESSKTVVVGDYVTISATVEGSLPLSFVWKRDGVVIGDGNGISGSASPTLVMDPVSAALAGTYRLEVTNSKGTTVSEPIVITVKVPPEFVHRPLNQLVKVGDEVTFDATAMDSGPVSYQWKRNGATIPGATDPVLSIPNVTYADEGHYEVIATGVEAANWSTFSLNVSPADTDVLAVEIWGQPSFSDIAYVPPGVGPVTDIATGPYNVSAVRSDGSVQSWGILSLFPAGGVNGPTEAVGVAVGEYHTTVLLADGRVVQRQTFDNKPPPVPAGLRNVVELVARGDGNVALKSDGTVVCWGVNQPPAGLGSVVSVSLGVGSAYALKSDGSVVGWSTGIGQFVDVPSGLSGVKAISAGSYHCLALKTNGTVFAWGENSGGQIDVPAGLTGVIEVSAGSAHSVALKSDGTAIRWGSPYGSPAETRPDLEPIATLSAGYGYSMVLTTALLPPQITTQPVSMAVRVNGYFRLSAGASGRPNPTFQWQKNGADIEGANGIYLDFGAAKKSDEGTYRFVASSVAGVAYSDEVAVTVLDPVAQPVFSPPEGNYPVGQPVAITSATAGATIRYTTDGNVPTETYGTIYTGPVALLDSTFLYAIAYEEGFAVSDLQAAYYGVTPNHVPQYVPASVPRGVVGAPFQLQLTGTGGDGALHWSVATGSLPAGLSLSSSGLLSGTPSGSGTSTFAVKVIDSDAVVAAFDEDTGTLTITMDATDSVPSITTTSLPDAGLSIAYSAALSGSGGNGPLSWSKAGGSLPPGLTLSPNGVISGAPTSLGTFNFTVKVADDDTITGPSDEATKELSITVIAAPRLINVSARTFAGSGGSTFIMGFVIEGTGQKTVVIRGVGPKLADFDVPLFVTDPAIKLFKLDGTLVAENDDWTSTVAANTGGFSLPVGSKDAALEVDLPPGGYTVHLLNPGALAEAVIEVYDISHDAGTRLSNVSCRLDLPPGQIVILGTVLAGGGRSIIVRNSGPGLAPYLLESERPLVAPDPVLNFHDAGGATIGANDDWDASLGPYFNAIGAFPLPAGSKDAAARLTLTPGGYTVHATANGPGGIILIELYELP